MSVAVTGGSGSFAYFWEVRTGPNTWATLGGSPLPLPCGGSASASPPNNAATGIRVTPCPGVRTYTIRARVASVGCGWLYSAPAVILVSTADFDGDGDIGTDADIEAFFACLGGSCSPTCGSADFNGDGDIGTDADIESFFRVLGGGPC